MGISKKSKLLETLEKKLSIFDDFDLYETKSRILIKNQDDIFTSPVIKKITNICDIENVRFNVIMENAKVKVEIFKVS